MRVLLVEDQAEVADALAREFRRLGFDADRAGCIAEAEEALRESSYGLTLVDRRLPDGDGLALIPKMRRVDPDMRIILLTACDRREDIISGLDCGADDYVTKPFHFDELMARIRTVLRRGGRDRPPPIVLGALRFDPYTRDVSINGISTPIHGRELALLEILVTNAGRMVDRRTILREIYGGADVVVPKALNMLVVRLRRWVVEVDAGVAIHSLRGVGYMLQKAPD
jgi:two-component system OmpR family response regulator